MCVRACVCVCVRACVSRFFVFDLGLISSLALYNATSCDGQNLYEIGIIRHDSA